MRAVHTRNDPKPSNGKDSAMRSWKFSTSGGSLMASGFWYVVSRMKDALIYFIRL